MKGVLTKANGNRVRIDTLYDERIYADGRNKWDGRDIFAHKCVDGETVYYIHRWTKQLGKKERAEILCKEAVQEFIDIHVNDVDELNDVDKFYISAMRRHGFVV